MFEDDIIKTRVNYFILDSKGKPGNHGDVDFISYDWSPSRYNRVKVGDLFLYRRPGSASEIKGKFYFFGAGKIIRIESIGNDRLRGYIGKPISFDKILLPEDLENFKWQFKHRGSTWEHFFNQYGMNQILKEDFIGVLKLSSDGNTENYGEDIIEEKVKLVQQQQKHNYFVDDHRSIQKVRIGHKVFADQVKLNYGYKCAITGITTKSFLVASHIVPWSLNKDNRLNPQNGICLSILVDKAFEEGYLGISEDYRVILAPNVKRDYELYMQLKPFENKRIKYPRSSPPGKDFLKWHLTEKFNGWHCKGKYQAEHGTN